MVQCSSFISPKNQAFTTACEPKSAFFTQFHDRHYCVENLQQGYIRRLWWVGRSRGPTRRPLCPIELWPQTQSSRTACRNGDQDGFQSRPVAPMLQAVGLPFQKARSLARPRMDSFDCSMSAARFATPRAMHEWPPSASLVAMSTASWTQRRVEEDWVCRTWPPASFCGLECLLLHLAASASPGSVCLDATGSRAEENACGRPGSDGYGNMDRFFFAPLL
jgi:hypothetical protein